MPCTYVGLGSDPPSPVPIVIAKFRYKEGVQQDTVEAGLCFPFVINDANRITNDELRLTGGTFLAGTDDTYIYAFPSVAFPSLVRHVNCIVVIGLVLNVHKTKCCIHPDFRTASYRHHRGDITEGSIRDL